MDGGTPTPSLEAAQGIWLAYNIYWPFQCLQTLAVVMVCAMPDLLMRQLSLLMAASKAITLVVTLLMVITGGFTCFISTCWPMW